MRLLIVHNEYSSFSGEEQAIRALAGLFEENGHQVSCFLRSSADIWGIQGKVLAFFSGIHSPKAVKELRRFIRGHSFDAALIQNLYPFFSSSILPVFREFNLPVIMRCPNYRLFCPNGLHLSRGEICQRCLGGREYWCVLKNCENDLLKSIGYALRNAAARITRQIVGYVDQFVVLSEFQRQKFIRGGIAPEKLKVAPNIAPSLEREPSGEPGEYVSFVGRVSPEKGIEEFFAAAARLPEIPFAVAGDHGRMPGIKAKAPVNIKWLGFLSGKALDDFFAKSRALVIPSRWFEGFPNVIARAMAYGKPVVASRLGGVPEIVDHGKTGMLCQPGNITEMAESIRHLYADPQRCILMGRAGRIKAQTQYSPEAVYQKWVEVFDSVRR